MSTSEPNELRSTSSSPDAGEYYSKQVMPWLIEHLRMRSTGLQFFSAIQGGLLVGWSAHHHWSIPIVALISCLSFHLWDLRVRHVLRSLVALGDRLVDQPRFGLAEDGHARDGVFAFAVRTRRRISVGTRVKTEGSHTSAINVLLVGAVVLWLVILYVTITA